MREGKFRGKRKDDGKWIYGYYVYTHDRHRIIYEDKEGFYCEDEVIAETVGPCTGLKDNDIDVYKDDIIHILEIDNNGETEYNAVVEYDDYAFILKPIDNENCETWLAICSKDNVLPLVDWKIIGNIHDNPELLEG